LSFDSAPLAGSPCSCLGVRTKAGHLRSNRAAGKAVVWAVHLTSGCAAWGDGLRKRAVLLCPSCLHWCSSVSRPFSDDNSICVALWNHYGWKRPLRSSSPTVNPIPPCLLNHILKCVLIGAVSVGLVSRIRSVRRDQQHLLELMQGWEQVCGTASLVAVIYSSGVTELQLYFTRNF